MENSPHLPWARQQLGLRLAHGMLCFPAMKAVFKVSRLSGGFITASVAPANRSQITRFSLAEGALVLVMVLGTAALIRLVLAG
jgi:hypothetical protein